MTFRHDDALDKFEDDRDLEWGDSVPSDLGGGSVVAVIGASCVAEVGVAGGDDDASTELQSKELAMLPVGMKSNERIDC